jgi:hypothetical protein
LTGVEAVTEDPVMVRDASTSERIPMAIVARAKERVGRW